MVCLEYPLGMSVCSCKQRGEDKRWETEHPTMAIAIEASANLCKKMKRGRAPDHVTCESPKNDSKILVGGFLRGKMGLKGHKLWGGALSQ